MMEKFLRALVARLRRAGFTATAAKDGEALIVLGRRLPVGAYFLSYEAASFFGRRAVIKRTTHAILAGLVELDALDSYDTARPRLRAQVTTAAAVELRRLQSIAIPGSTTLRQVARRLAGDLLVEAIVDLPAFQITVGPGHLTTWAVDAEEVIDDAIIGSATQIELSLEVFDGFAIHRDVDRGGAAALVAFGYLLEHAAQDLPASAAATRRALDEVLGFDPARAVAMVPHESTLLLFDRASVAGWTLAATYLATFADGGAPLSAVVVGRADGAWHLVEPPADPALDLCRRQLAEARAAIDLLRYLDQRPALAAAFADLAVAAVAREVDADGAVVGTAFTRGRSTLLPRAERVTLIDLARPTQTRDVTWQQLATLDGVTVEPFDVIPPRWRVEGWPRS